MNKQTNIIIVIVILVALGGIYLINKGNSENESAISITGYYDANHNLIKSGMAIVGGVPNVQYITLSVNVKNTDTVPLTLSMVDATPISFKNALGTNTLTIQPGASGKWDSSQIEVTPFIGKSQIFTVKVKASSSSRVNVEKDSSLTLKIEPDSTSASFEVKVVSSNGGTGTDLSCVEAWSCTTGACVNGIKTKICTDANDCGTTSSRPALSESCTISSSSFDTNAGTTYSSFISGTWVLIDTNSDGILEKFNYNSISSSSCIGSLLTTYNGITINKYSGSQGTSIIICNNAGAGYKKYS